MNQVRLYKVFYDENGLATLDPINISPGELDYAKKIDAGMTFSFRYPNSQGFARSQFNEHLDIIRAVIDGSSVFLEGKVMSVTNDPVAIVNCADPLSRLVDEYITPEELNEYTGRDCGRVLADLIQRLDAGGGRYPEAIVGTSPIISLPQDFIEASSKLSDVVKKIQDFIRDETKALPTIAEREYFFGFISGTLRFEPVPLVVNESTTFVVNKDENLYEEEPILHFDRLVNTARAYGKDAGSGREQDSTIAGPIYRDEQSIKIFGVKEPEAILTLETSNLMELYEEARRTVEKNKGLFFTTKLEIPDAHFLTPGIHTVDIQSSVYGLRGKSRIVQVQGSIGSNGHVKVDLASLPLDDVEVLRKVLGLN